MSEAQPNYRDRLRLDRRSVLVGAAGGAFLGVLALAAHDGLKPLPPPVPGFEWSDIKYPPIPDPGRKEIWCGFMPKFRERSLREGRHVGILCVALEQVAAAYPQSSSEPWQLGFMYRRQAVDSCPSDGDWHQGMGPPNTLFGSLEPSGAIFLHAGVEVGIGTGELQISWAIRVGEETERLPTCSFDITGDIWGDAAIPYSRFKRDFPRMPLLHPPAQ